MSIDDHKKQTEAKNEFSFQYPDFSVQLPEDMRDHSNYAFSFPEFGGLPPRINISIESVEQSPDLIQLQDEYLENLCKIAPGSTTTGVKSGLSSGKFYSVQTIRWLSDSAKLSSMVLFLLESKEAKSPRMATIITSDLAENVFISEPMFNKIIRSFDFH